MRERQGCLEWGLGVPQTEPDSYEGTLPRTTLLFHGHTPWGEEVSRVKRPTLWGAGVQCRRWPHPGRPGVSYLELNDTQGGINGSGAD